MSRALYLHVGHEKTGSSFIQSALALSTSSLRYSGIAYPWHLDASAARKGHLSSGNGDLLLSRSSPRLPMQYDRVLLSGEMLFHQLRRPQVVRRIRRHAARWGIEHIKILLFIRDPLEHAMSMYQQDIKRRGSTADLDAYIDSYDFPDKVVSFLSCVTSMLDAEVRIRNYSRHRSDLLAQVQTWLGIDGAVLSQPPISTVNRSLTAPELALQINVNKVLGSRGRLVADALCNDLPRLKGLKVIPDAETQVRLLHRLEPALNEVNSHCDPEEQYRHTRLRVAESPDAALSMEQVHVATMALAKALEHCCATPPVQVVEAVDRVRRRLRQRAGALAMFRKIS